MKFQKPIESGKRPASDRPADLEQVAELMARFHRISWKQALGQIASPAFRLHRYRNVHNRLLQNAFCELDSKDRGECSG